MCPSCCGASPGAGPPRVRRIAAVASSSRRWSGPAAWGDNDGRFPGVALAIGFTLLGAWVAGDGLRRLQLPRLTGYLLFGVLVGPYLGNVINQSMAAQMQVITGVAPRRSSRSSPA